MNRSCSACGTAPCWKPHAEAHEAAGAAGAGIEKLRKDTELPAGVASEIQTRLTKGSSALVLVGETADVNVLDAATMQFAVRDRLRQTLPDDVVDGMTGRFA